jgi:hypothetical protein
MIMEKMMTQIAKHEKSISRAIVITLIGISLILAALKIIPFVNAKEQEIFPAISLKEMLLYLYLAGLGLSVSIIFVNAIYSLLRWNTIFVRNMRIAGYQYSPLTGSSQWDDDDELRIFRLVFECIIMILLAATSWIYVLGVVIVLSIRLANRTRKPEKITEINYILSSSILPKNEIQNLLIEKRKFLKLEPEPFEQDLYSFKLNDTSWAQIFPDIQEITIDWHSDDHFVSGRQILQYRIVDEMVEARTRESHSVDHGAEIEKDYEIIDYVYVENAKRFSMTTPDEWKEKTQWHQIHNPKIVYHILKLHHPEYKRILRQKIEDNKAKIAIGKNEIEKLKIPLYETEFGFWLVDPNESVDNSLPAQIAENKRAIEIVFNEYHIDWQSFWRHKEFELEILTVINKTQLA